MTREDVIPVDFILPDIWTPNLNIEGGDSMTFLKTCSIGQNRCLSVLFLTALVLVVEPQVSEAQSYALTNLDVTHVEFSMAPMGGGKGYNHLYARAIQKLKDAGLYHPTKGIAGPGKHPLLVLNLKVLDLGPDSPLPDMGNTCPGKWLYMQKIEMWEDVYTQRNPHTRIWTISWQRIVPYPIIVDSIPMERLEADVDSLIGEFIADYKQGNVSKKREN